MDLNGHIVSPVRGSNGYATPAGCSQSILFKQELIENHIFIAVFDSLKRYKPHVSPCLIGCFSQGTIAFVFISCLQSLFKAAEDTNV